MLRNPLSCDELFAIHQRQMEHVSECLKRSERLLRGSQRRLMRSGEARRDATSSGQISTAGPLYELLTMPCELGASHQPLIEMSLGPQAPVWGFSFTERGPVTGDRVEASAVRWSMRPTPELNLEQDASDGPPPRPAHRATRDLRPAQTGGLFVAGERNKFMHSLFGSVSRQPP
jgi:hypothetical protein